VWFTEFSADNVGRLLASPSDVLMLPSGFVPKTRSTVVSGSVLWMFDTPGAHALSDTSGAISSGVMNPGSTYPVVFPGAGTYRYSDTQGTAAGTVRVPMAVKPSSGTTQTSFTITWSKTAPEIFTGFDVQIKRPGSGSF